MRRGRYDAAMNNAERGSTSRGDLRVHLLPELTAPQDLAGRAVVVIDVLRASTTITTALAHGAAAVIPCLEVAEARRLAAKIEHPCLLGGERGGQPINGFDLGNSPAEYTAERVGGKLIVFTTTNGTKALMRCVGAARILIGSFVNLTAICDALAREPQIDLLCAGTHGAVTREDALAAGAIVERLLGRVPDIQLNDQARIALDAWRTVSATAQSPQELSALLAATLRDTGGGRNLLNIGRGDDLPRAAAIDAFLAAPKLDQATWRIALKQR